MLDGCELNVCLVQIHRRLRNIPVDRSSVSLATDNDSGPLRNCDIVGGCATSSPLINRGVIEVSRRHTGGVINLNSVSHCGTGAPGDDAGQTGGCERDRRQRVWIADYAVSGGRRSPAADESFRDAERNSAGQD